jgi:hypothetical protein
MQSLRTTYKKELEDKQSIIDEFDNVTKYDQLQGVIYEDEKSDAQSQDTI